MKRKDKIPANGDELPIRNSTAEFLIFAKDKAIGEYEKFRVRQELEFKNDFDRQLDLLEEQARQANDGETEGKH